MLASLKFGADFSAGCAGEVVGHSILKTHPPADSRIKSRKRQPGQRRTGLTTYHPPRSFDQVMRLRHHLVYVVVVAVLDAGADASCLRGPQAVADPALAEGCHARGRPVRGIS